uniref:C-type lectin domain-containing protein n=1 Tax=Seriola lalandi dorsalis TaxID=1841481 RepID=A0A3B4X7S4_SERLL
MMLSLFLSLLVSTLCLHPVPVALSSLHVHSTSTSAHLTWKLHRQESLSTLSLYNTHTQSEDLLFVSSHLLNHNNLLLLWTGLSDQQVEEGQPLWSDGASYNLTDTMKTFLPASQTDCFALQRNATGPGYFLTPFFCNIPLPFICQYQSK